MITILNPSFQPLAVIERYDNDSVDETINGEYKFSFSTVIDEDGKSEYLTDGYLAEVEEQLFNIVHHRRTRAGDGSTLIAIECEQVSYDLLLPEFAWEDGFVNAGTPEQLLDMALAGTGFTIGMVELSEIISVDLAEENISTRAILLEIAAQSGGELLFDRYSISLLVRRGALRGVRYQLGKNLRGIVKDVDTRSGERVTAYEVDVIELNSLPEFYGLEYFELGDTVWISDQELGIDEQQRIVGYSYSPRRRINSKVTISNAITGIKDAVVGLRKTTIVKDKAYYGNRFGPDIGFESVRYDKLARSVFNADEFRMQKGNGSGSWTDAIFFNPLEGEYEFTGLIRASSFEGGTIMIGSGDDAFRASVDGVWLGNESFADAPFSVTPGGHMKAVDAEFTGLIRGSSFEGGTIMIGSGNDAFRASDLGIWLGNESFANAPFGVTPEGHMRAVNAEFSGKITASDIDGGVITGAKYQTSDTKWPRVVIDPSSVAFGVYADANNGVRIPAFEDGVTKIQFIENGNESTIYNSSTAGFNIVAFSDARIVGANIYLAASQRVHFPSWSVIYGDSNGRSLQSEFDDIWLAIAGKAQSNHTHTVNISTHNHGNSENQNWGGSFQTSAAQ